MCDENTTEEKGDTANGNDTVISVNVDTNETASINAYDHDTIQMTNTQKEKNDATKTIPPIVYATAILDDSPNETLSNYEIESLI